ncbi:MAG: hypothetical protein ACRD12_13295 [Acidimicrobiales bacterium]
MGAIVGSAGFPDLLMVLVMFMGTPVYTAVALVWQRDAVRLVHGDDPCRPGRRAIVAALGFLVGVAKALGTFVLILLPVLVILGVLWLTGQLDFPDRFPILWDATIPHLAELVAIPIFAGVFALVEWRFKPIERVAARTPIGAVAGATGEASSLVAQSFVVGIWIALAATLPVGVVIGVLGSPGGPVGAVAGMCLIGACGVAVGIATAWWWRG